VIGAGVVKHYFPSGSESEESMLPWLRGQGSAAPLGLSFPGQWRNCRVQLDKAGHMYVSHIVAWDAVHNSARKCWSQPKLNVDVVQLEEPDSVGGPEGRH
jgi:hypothetical protein